MAAMASRGSRGAPQAGVRSPKLPGEHFDLARESSGCSVRGPRSHQLPLQHPPAWKARTLISLGVPLLWGGSTVPPALLLQDVSQDDLSPAEERARVSGAGRCWVPGSPLQPPSTPAPRTTPACSTVLSSPLPSPGDGDPAPAGTGWPGSPVTGDGPLHPHRASCPPSAPGTVLTRCPTPAGMCSGAAEPLCPHSRDTMSQFTFYAEYKAV